MTDIVERLRKGWDDRFQTMADAAAEIERLRHKLDEFSAQAIAVEKLVPELNAEIERLRIDVRDQANVELSEENDRLIDDNERLRREIEEWRIAAIKMRSQDEYDRLTDEAAAEIERCHGAIADLQAEVRRKSEEIEALRPNEQSVQTIHRDFGL